MISILRNNRRVKEYDERLRFGKNEERGDYCVFMLMPHGEPARPILGFGNDIPSEDRLMERLAESDTQRHGQYMRDHINRVNAEKAKEMEWKSLDSIGPAAERVEDWHRRRGSHPVPRIFVPSTESTEKVSDDGGS
jgi:hypothetical protein